ncbi:MAG TPA: hypothetical protein DDW67_09160 [Elusimicrobia bacterium]|nr:hypothetical protein [Elusimicrobiota bacterium]
MKSHAQIIPVFLAALFASTAPCPLSGALGSGGGYELESSVLNPGGGASYGGGYRVKGAAAQVLPPSSLVSAAAEYVNRAGFYNPPHFTYEGGRPVALTTSSGDLTLSLPADSIDKFRFDITLNRNPLNQPLAVDPGLINDASGKMTYNEGSWSRLFPDHLTEFAVFDEQDFYRKPLANRGLMTMRYKDEDGDGNIDGSYPPVRADTLNAWTLDEESRMWVALPSAGVDKVSRTLSLYFGLPGVYALIGQLDTAVNNVFAYPVPFRPNGPQAGSGAGQTGTEAGGITFTNVPQQGDIEIYTLDGRLVRKLGIPDNLMMPKLKWDVRTASGDKAASGTYIWRVVSGGNSRTGKLMVIW